MNKKFISLLLTAALVFILCSCGRTGSGTTSQPDTTVPETSRTELLNVATLMGPTGIGMGRLMETGKSKYAFTVSSMPDEISSGLLSGSFDFAACPLNLAAVLYNKSQGKIKLLAINTLGVLYIVENGSSIHSIADLKGKTVIASGLGATPEYVIKYLLVKNGLDPEKDVTLEFKAEHSEVSALASSGAEGIYLLPEPNVTSALAQNSNLRIALDITAEWDKISDTSLAMGCVVARSEISAADCDAFLAACKESADYIVAPENIDAAAALAQSNAIVPKAEIAKQAIPRCNITFIAGAEMKQIAVDNFNVLFNYNPKSVGGTMPNDDFYYGA